MPSTRQGCKAADVYYECYIRYGRSTACYELYEMLSRAHSSLSGTMSCSEIQADAMAPMNHYSLITRFALHYDPKSGFADDDQSRALMTN